MDLIPLPEACRLARHSYSRLYQLVLRGAIRSERRGARWFVAREDAESLARSAPSRPSVVFPPRKGKAA